MTLARLCIMLGIVAFIIGVISFVLPGEFLYSGDIISFVSTFGSLLIPGLGSNPSLCFFVQKSPSFLFVILGLILTFIGIARARK